MKLPVLPPVSPMLAKLVHELPETAGTVYEPKWDGFRSIVFRDGEEIELASRNERPLTRYFPELIAPLLSALPTKCVLDGEIVIVADSGLDFDALQQRIHPAASRVTELSQSTPASFVAFDLLALGDRDLRSAPYHERRAELERIVPTDNSSVVLTPATTDRSLAEEWFSKFEGAGFDGLIAKAPDLAYREGERVMWKLKHERTADCVVAGYRTHRTKKGVGSLLLGLFDNDGVLHHVGVTATFTDKVRVELLDKVSSYLLDEGETHPWLDGEDSARRPGGESRWTQGRDLTFTPLRPTLVCEVAYDHLQGDRFRHATTFRRWREDRTPTSCRYDQLEVVVPSELKTIFRR